MYTYTYTYIYIYIKNDQSVSEQCLYILYLTEIDSAVAWAEGSSSSSSIVSASLLTARVTCQAHHLNGSSN